MQRRQINSGVAILSLCACIRASANPTAKVWRIGYLGNLPPTTTESRAVVDAFLLEMERSGWIRSKNIEYDFRFANGINERFPQLARELVNSRVDLIAAMTTSAARAAKEATANIPVVFIAAEPVEYGLITSLSHPGANLTGMAILIDELLAKRMQLIMQAIPNIKSIAYLGMNEVKSIAFARAAARSLGVELLSVQVAHPEGLLNAITSAPHADAWLVDEYPMFNAHRRQIIDMIGAQRKPAIYSSIAWAREGGLISYSDDSIELWRGAARYIDRVIRGAKPSELPVQEPTRFKLALNRKTAFVLGVVIQKQFLLQVDEIIH